MPLASGEHRWHDHRTGMHRTAFERIVEILAMGGGAVDKSGTHGRQRACVADRRAWTVIVTAGERAPDIVFVARGNAQPHDIDQQILAFARGRGRKRARLQCSDLRGKRFGNRNFGQTGGHSDQTRKILV